MLKKLLKYDIAYALRFLWAFYLIGLFFAAVSRAATLLPESSFSVFLAGFCRGVSISMIFNAIINNVIFVWRRFKSTLYGDAAYLYHTLPVKKSAHYLSRIFSAVLSIFLSVAVSALMLFIAFYSKDNIELVKTFLEPIANAFESNIFAILITLTSLIFLQLVNIMQFGITGIILGHRKNNNKLAFSFLFGFIAYIITQGINLISAVLFGLMNDDIMLLFTSSTMPSISAIKQIIAICIIIYAVLVAALCLINVKLLNRGVNID